MLIIICFLASFIFFIAITVLYVRHQKVAIALQIKPDLAYFYLINIAFILLLNWIYSFVLKLFNASSGGLEYAR